VSALDGEADGFAHFEADAADGAWFFFVVCFYGVFGFGVLDGTTDFAESTAHAVLLVSDYFFHKHAFRFGLA
jgi:hypothetical protein